MVERKIDLKDPESWKGPEIFEVVGEKYELTEEEIQELVEEFRTEVVKDTRAGDFLPSLFENRVKKRIINGE